MTGVDWLADSSSSCWRLWHFPVILKVFLCLSHALMHSWYRSNYSDAPKCVPHYPTRWFCGIIMKAAASVGSQEVFDFLPTSHIWEAYLPPGDASLRRESQVPRREKSVNVWWHSGHSEDDRIESTIIFLAQSQMWHWTGWSFFQENEKSSERKTLKDPCSNRAEACTLTSALCKRLEESEIWVYREVI